jgi:hypothetical protein
MNKATLLAEIMQLTPKERQELADELLGGGRGRRRLCPYAGADG